jgi:hypothetical protein
MQTLVWSIVNRGRLVQVGEDGSLEGDPDLVDHLRRRLSEPVTVYRHGTVRSDRPEEMDALELRPGDGRYMVARIRLLCADEPEFEIVACDWKEST